MAKESHIDGIVCSGHELKNSLSIDKEFPQKTLKVCPGIRLKTDESHDQQRVMSPQEAFKRGADYLVIGRSITLAPEKLDNPKTIYSIAELNSLLLAGIPLLYLTDFPLKYRENIWRNHE